jgi:hypothetical protein
MLFAVEDEHAREQFDFVALVFRGKGRREWRYSQHRVIVAKPKRPLAIINDHVEKGLADSASEPSCP